MSAWGTGTSMGLRSNRFRFLYGEDFGVADEAVGQVHAAPDQVIFPLDAEGDAPGQPAKGFGGKPGKPGQGA